MLREGVGEAGVGVRLEIDPVLAGSWTGSMIGMLLPMPAHGGS